MLLLLLTSNALASPLPVRVDWMRAAGVGQVQFYGQFGDGHLIGGVDGRGRLRVALERQQRTGAWSVAWGTTIPGDAREARLIRLDNSAPVDVLWRSCTGRQCAVIGLDAHTGHLLWRVPGEVDGQRDEVIFVQGGGRRVRVNIWTREGTGLARP